MFASRGYSVDQPLAVALRDLPNTFTDIAASTPLANLCTDAFRNATKADIGFSVNGLVRQQPSGSRAVGEPAQDGTRPRHAQATAAKDLGPSGWPPS